MAFNKQQLVKDYKEAFGHNAALPMEAASSPS